MKNYGTLDEAYIVVQLELASAHSKFSSGKMVFPNFYRLHPSLCSEKEEKKKVLHMHKQKPTFAKVLLIYKETKCMTAGVHFACQ